MTKDNASETKVRRLAARAIKMVEDYNTLAKATYTANGGKFNSQDTYAADDRLRLAIRHLMEAEFKERQTANTPVITKDTADDLNRSVDGRADSDAKNSSELPKTNATDLSSKAAATIKITTKDTAGERKMRRLAARVMKKITTCQGLLELLKAAGLANNVKDSADYIKYREIAKVVTKLVIDYRTLGEVIYKANGDKFNSQDTYTMDTQLNSAVMLMWKAEMQARIKINLPVITGDNTDKAPKSAK